MPKKGDMLRVVVTPYAGSLKGAPVTSEPILLKNAAPRVTNVSISPADPTVISILTAIVKYNDSDTGDVLKVEYQWFKNGIAIDSATGVNISAPEFSKGDKVVVKVMVTDGIEYSGEVGSAAVVVGNSAPILTGDKVSPETGGDENTDYKFSVQYSDADSDIPDTVYVLIDQESYEMKKVSGSPKTGIIYEYVTKLSAGDHSYQFAAGDGIIDATPTNEKTIKVAQAPADLLWAIAVAVLIIIVVLLLLLDHLMRKPKEPQSPRPLKAPSKTSKSTNTDEDSKQDHEKKDDKLKENDEDILPKKSESKDNVKKVVKD